MQLRSSVAVAVVWAGRCTSRLTPIQKLPYATGVAVKRRKKKYSDFLPKKQKAELQGTAKYKGDGGEGDAWENSPITLCYER